ncbi:phosphonoacetaldehyde dehydrogenase [Propionivibrio soli]|uniref:phosphonoacetaldehyde dehydrogenase n=1 Tax=Propionivibrio soli TaxID=2976531 RepID=UPI0021E78E18|nr:phosphonoacetaldehyde dehydrogenase [Propionivibrio soli]
MSAFTIRRESMRVASGRPTGDGRVIEVLNPYSGECVGTVPKASVDDVRAALEAAAKYRPTLTRADRAAILQQAAESVVSRKQEISDLITAESGLCKQDTLYEVGRVRDVLLFAAQAALQDDGQIFSCDITPHGRHRRVFTQRSPLLGVITAITPFNHPMNQVAHKVAPAIATNNRMVLKPSEKVPLSALLFADILYEAGLPVPMFQVVTGEPAEIADELLTNHYVDLVSFTGGVSVGKYIASKVGYRRVVLELGGNDPLIVMDDADLDEAAALAVTGSYKNSGQRCTAVKRILVQNRVADEFVDRLVEKTTQWRFGNPTDETQQMGTVIDEAAAKVFQSRVEDAVALGAELRCGNQREGALYAPTVVDHVTSEMSVVRYETFGPVSPVIRFETVDDAIEIVNGSAYGLSSGVCTNRLDVITRLVNELQVGSVNVREVPGYRLELTPFGGIKDSGLGYKEGVQEAMKSFTNVKTYSLPWPA